MISTSMTTEQILRAWQQQRAADLQEAKNMRNHWQAVVDRLEKQIDSFDSLSPEAKEAKTDLIKRYAEITAEKQDEIRSRNLAASMGAPSRGQIREEQISKIFRKRAREDFSALD